ncbi:fibrinogen-like protein A [Portunus trituberculatus]|uniref:fibrinogen-like protein A n=1 Tax=Portunus trituberculatus TaxID=210409 RepID=UPI001E1CEA80|nr:fibrinogen-like protein A [Portunus trituberculatus]
MKTVNSAVLLCLLTMAIGKVETMDPFWTASDEYSMNDIDDDNDITNSTDNPIENIAQNLTEIMKMIRGTYDCLMKRINLLKFELKLLYENVTKARDRIIMLDCSDMMESNNGSTYYTFYMDIDDKNPIRIYCDFDTEGGGWTVIQVRRPTVEKLTFDRKWSEYYKGFGSPDTNQFVGILNIYKWMLSRMYELRINVRDQEGKTGYAKYERFHLEGEHCGYRMMQFVYSGTAGDSLEFAISSQTEETGEEISIHHGMKFSTSDRDSTASNCSQKYKSGWWFSDDCGKSNLNGPYLDYGQHQDGRKGICVALRFHALRYQYIHRCRKTRHDYAVYQQQKSFRDFQTGNENLKE